MKRLSAGLLFAALLFPCPASENEAVGKLEKAPLPDGPLLKRAPEYSRWTVTYHYADAVPERDSRTQSTGGGGADPAPAGQLLRWTIAKSQNVYFEQKVFADGASKESWRFGSMQINMSSASHTPTIYDPSSFANSAGGEMIADPAVYTDYSKTDFPGLEWVSPQTYIGIQKREGQECLVFQDGKSSSLPLRAGHAGPATTAFISIQTRLPVFLERGGATANYGFETQPSIPIALPPELQQFLEKRANGIKTMTTTSPSF